MPRKSRNQQAAEAIAAAASAALDIVPTAPETEERIVAALEAGYSPAQVAQSLGVPLGIIYRACASPEAAGRLQSAAGGVVAAALPEAIASIHHLMGNESPWVRLQAAQAMVGIARGQEQGQSAQQAILWDTMPTPGEPDGED